MERCPGVTGAVLNASRKLDVGSVVVQKDTDWTRFCESRPKILIGKNSMKLKNDIEVFSITRYLFVVCN